MINLIQKYPKKNEKKKNREKKGKKVRSKEVIKMSRRTERKILQLKRQFFFVTRLGKSLEPW